MSPEIKAKVFDIDTLTLLEKVYQYIQLFTPYVNTKDVEGNIKMLMHDVRKGSETIRNLKID
jgi:hypothetical protein